MSDLVPMMPKYEAYKDSGVDWIGEIPEHWKVRPIKQYSRIYSGDTIINSALNDDSAYEVFGGNGFMGYANKFNVEGMNIIIGRVGAYCGNIRLIHDRKWVSDNALVLSLKNENDYSFFAYLLEAATLNNLNVSNAQPLITATKILNVRIVCPPLDEQTAIAAFLDCKTAKIDQAVAIKEKQIQLLKERKQILIQTAVTKGLDPNVPMRDSGVEWIGEIPAHWQVKRAKYLFKEIDERSTTGKEELLSVSHMTGVTPRSEKNVNMFMAEDYTGSKTCQKNDLIFNIMWAWMGALGVSDRPGIVSSSYGIFRQLTRGQFNPCYLENLLKTTGYIEHYNKVSTGLHSSRLRFYGHMFFNMEIGFPDIKEQDQIVIHIQTQSDKIDKAIAIQEQMIEKLKEYKATLINSAVTGKIKVPQTLETKAVA